MGKLGAEIKVGLLVLAGTLAIIVGSVAVTGWKPTKTLSYVIKVSFPNVSGLLHGSPVLVSGIKIGEVDSIDLVEGRAQLTLSIYTRYTLYADAVATIKSIGILGDKYVDIKVGTPTQLPLVNGNYIYLVNTGADLDSLVESATGVLSDLKVVTQTLRETIGNIMTDLGKFTHALGEEGPDLTHDLRTAMGKLDSTLASLDSISGKMDRGEGTIGRLINDETTVEELNNTLVSVNGLIGDTAKLKMDVGVQTFMLLKQGVFKSALTISLAPHAERYYLMQLVDDPRGKGSQKTTTTTTGTTTTDTTTTTVTQQLQWSLLIAQRYYDTLVRGGLMESHFGLGVTQYFGHADQFQLAMDVYDFGGVTGPRLTATGLWKFFSNGYMLVGADDIISKKPTYKDAFFGVGVTFNEDSLRTLMGSIPFSSISAP